MDLAKTLIRSVARAFYETKHILVVDALLVHSALRDDDLAHLLGMQTKELRKLCAKLDEHRLLSVHNRQEMREGMQRPISKTYYFIDFRQTIDAIKYRIYRVTKEVEALIRPTDERKDYYCPRCGSRWTQMEVLDSIGPNGFICHKCGASLERDDENIGDGGGHEMQSKLMKQLEPLLALLPRIDEVIIPDNNFETAFNAAIPVQRNQITNPVAGTVPLSSATNQPATVKGLTQLAPQRIEVDLTSSEEKTAAEQAAEAERKARLAEQNALPIWHTNSTVSGEKTALGSKEEAARRERDQLLGTVRVEDANEDKKLISPTAEAGEINDEVAQYYAQLAQDQAKAKIKDEEGSSSGAEDDDDDDEDEEEEDEFEDVPTITTNNGTGSKPSITVNGASTHTPAMTMTRILSVEGSEEETSSSVPTASATGISTPAAAIATSTTITLTTAVIDEGEEEAHGPAKRARIDNGEADGDAKQDRQAPDEEDDEDEEDEVEFEDV